MGAYLNKERQIQTVREPNPRRSDQVERLSLVRWIRRRPIRIPDSGSSVDGHSSLIDKTCLSLPISFLSFEVTVANAKTAYKLNNLCWAEYAERRLLERPLCVGALMAELSRPLWRGLRAKPSVSVRLYVFGFDRIGRCDVDVLAFLFEMTGGSGQDLIRHGRSVSPHCIHRCNCHCRLILSVGGIEPR